MCGDRPFVKRMKKAAGLSNDKVLASTPKGIQAQSIG
jgi:hypothetical protein